MFSSIIENVRYGCHRLCFGYHLPLYGCHNLFCSFYAWCCGSHLPLQFSICRFLESRFNGPPTMQNGAKKSRSFLHYTQKHDEKLKILHCICITCDWNRVWKPDAMRWGKQKESRGDKENTPLTIQTTALISVFQQLPLRIQGTGRSGGWFVKNRRLQYGDGDIRYWSQK